jgi:hypothetical protein
MSSKPLAQDGITSWWKTDWALGKDAIGTKYRISVVVTMKKAGSPDRVYSSPTVEVEVKK